MSNYKFKNGVEIKVTTLTQLEQVAKTFGETLDMKQVSALGFKLEGYYNSSTKGPVKISEMVDSYLMNATTAKMKNILNQICGNRANFKNFRTLLTALVGLTENVEIAPLLEEMSNRLEKEESSKK